MPAPSTKSNDVDEKDQRTDVAVGERIRLLRKVRGRSLKEVAERSGLSVGFLSQIERGLSSASIRALARIADALEVGIADVFPTDVGMDDAQRITARMAERKRVTLADTGMVKDLLTPFAQIPRLDIYILTLEPGGNSGDEAYGHYGEEAGYIMEGGLELVVDGKKYILGEGDSFRFSSNRPHRFSNPGDRIAKALWVNFRDK